MKKIKILREKDILFSRKVKRLKKDEKGITLIALVITIIFSYDENVKPKN